MDEEQLWTERLIAWLKDASPEDWHRVALDFNWNRRTDPLFWIVQQPECDKATALTIFWQAQPTYRLSHQRAEVSGEGDEGSAWNMVRFIGERIHAGGYARSKIAFDATPLLLQDYDELVAEGKKAADAPLQAHPDMKRSIRGREVRLDPEFYRRFPEEFHGSTMIELPETNMVTPYMEAARTEVTSFTINLVASGAIAAFLAGHGVPKSGNFITWIVAVSAICWCLFSSRSSMQAFQGIVRAEHLEMPAEGIRSVTILCVVLGAGLGLAYRLFLMSHVQALIGKFGVVATIAAGLVAVLPLLWLGASALARILVDRTTFR